MGSVELQLHHLPADLVYRPTWAEISLAALRANLDVVRGLLPPELGVVAMVKADAYGHGAVPTARVATAHGVAALGVATIEEGIELRLGDIDAPILLMAGLMGTGARGAAAVLEHRLTPVIHSLDGVRQLAEAAQPAGIVVPCHLKIDTGMSRLGLRPEQVPAVLATLRDHPAVRLEGVMTHLAQANDPEASAEQARRFAGAARAIQAAVPTPLVWHIGNSAAVLHHGAGASWCCPFAPRPGDRWWVRPGIMLYGIAPFSTDRGRAPLAPVMSLRSRIIMLKQIPRGTKVSYGGTWTALRPTRIATVPVGYADGYPWGAVGQSEVVIRGRRVPLVGRITMDMVVCDVTDLPGVEVGDEVALWGHSEGASIAAEDIATWSGTIPYEVVARVSKRVPRVYVE